MGFLDALYPKNIRMTRNIVMAILLTLALANLNVLNMIGLNLNSYNVPLLKWTILQVFNTIGILWVFFAVQNRKV